MSFLSYIILATCFFCHFSTRVTPASTVLLLTIVSIELDGRYPRYVFDGRLTKVANQLGTGEDSEETVRDPH